MLPVGKSLNQDTEWKSHQGSSRLHTQANAISSFEPIKCENTQIKMI